MNRILFLIATACTIVSLSGNRVQQDKPDCQAQSCQFVEDALKEYHQIKVGMTRKEIERRFRRDGGLQFPSQGVYVDPKCPYIKTRIKFKHVEGSRELLSPDDTVLNVSELFVAYPTMD
jgi:hypothetical protein